MAARNSEALDVFLKVAADSRVSWRTVEFAGRGISADAASVVWMLSRGKHSRSGEELADLLMGQIDLIDSLIELWRSFDSGELSEANFEDQLETIVLGLEEWISQASR
ncbi:MULTISPECIES: hypothetical protein [unclassified Streptomyces]|uniref:hypothetical protein n=1 Tax=unclassified Streptomyces TaxID=2593676 RepID=UPI002023EB15|nr:MULTISPECIES: hypothetical protein [unclassified Streptomyces]MCX4550501.1 hypothetical protein [Streptomyces sp. NBC_01500]WSV55905.1 hypothetical protein OG282_20580 [Streptomyces sp. NBC_01014]